VENRNLELIEYLIDHGADMDLKDYQGKTPLLISTEFRNPYNQMAIVKLLVDNGADVNAIVSFGYTPLHAAAYDGHTEITKYLIDNGADVNAKTKNGETPYDLATDKEIKQLLSAAMNK
jgi:ankyrin repeat protein